MLKDHNYYSKYYRAHISVSFFMETFTLNYTIYNWFLDLMTSLDDNNKTNPL